MKQSVVVILSGGIGGAKLVLGFARLAPCPGLLAVVNTGDDFEHLGLAICPDVDTILYTLGDLSDPDRGWGRRDETWFALGDRDLALHVEHTRLPGLLWSPAMQASRAWHHVRRRRVRHPHPRFVEALCDPSVEAIVIAPSNPHLSIDPTAASMAALGVDASPAAIAAHYKGMIDGLVIDVSDADPVPDLGISVCAVPTLMRDLADRQRLAGDVLGFAREIGAQGAQPRAPLAGTPLPQANPAGRRPCWPQIDTREVSIAAANHIGHREVPSR